METVRTVVDGLHRDTNSHSLVSLDVDAYKAYKRNRTQQLTLHSLNEQVQAMKSEINMLKQLIYTKMGQ